jgi:hypothetical protein
MTATLTREPVTDENWVLYAACRGDLRFADGPYGSHTNGHRGARELAHICRAHCPVIKQCTRDVQVSHPVGVVQAGFLWPDWWSRTPPRELAELGCGRWCEGRPHVHSGGA